MARYRVRLQTTDGNVKLERKFPSDDFEQDGCAFLDADLENNRSPNQTVDSNTEQSFRMHLQEVNDPEDFSSEYCPDMN